MIAAREHARQISFVIQAALDKAEVRFSDLDAVAVSCDQGLLLALVVGVSAAKSVALACNIPLIGIHHLEGHICSVLMGEGPGPAFPFLCLTVAGGHTLLVRVEDHGQYEVVGSTRDDAAGEALDKIARRLGLGYPGGAAIERVAANGDATAFALPRPMIRQKTLDFSFSGLKTAVVRVMDEHPDLCVADLCASFQQAVVDTLVIKTMRAARQTSLTRIALAGGVALNSLLRKTFKKAADRAGLQAFLAPRALCADNGAMVAGAGYFLYRERGADPLTIETRANAPLGRLSV